MSIETDTSKISATYIAVSPDVAERWLQANTVNRKTRQSRINQYAADMEAGRWQHSNDAITFDSNGNMLNGQHRLNAVVLSGCTITFLVVRNMPPESMTAMDQGAARSAGDALKFAGEANTSVLAASARLALLYHDGRIYKDNKVQRTSHGQILDFIDTHPTIKQSITEVAHKGTAIDAPNSTIIAAHWIISGVNEFPLATYYIQQLASRINEPEGSAVHAIDSRLREVRRNRNQYPQRNFIYLLLKGWNYYARDQQVRQINMSPRGEFKIPDPIKWERTP